MSRDHKPQWCRHTEWFVEVTEKIRVVHVHIWRDLEVEHEKGRLQARINELHAPCSVVASGGVVFAWRVEFRPEAKPPRGKLVTWSVPWQCENSGIVESICKGDIFLGQSSPWYDHYTCREETMRQHRSNEVSRIEKCDLVWEIVLALAVNVQERLVTSPVPYPYISPKRYDMAIDDVEVPQNSHVDMQSVARFIWMTVERIDGYWYLRKGVASRQVEKG